MGHCELGQVSQAEGGGVAGGRQYFAGERVDAVDKDKGLKLYTGGWGMGALDDGTEWNPMA